MGIDLAAELKMAPKDLGLFWLVVVTPDRGDVFRVPLLLDGSESEAHASARFQDALVVYRHRLMERDGRTSAPRERIDGIVSK